MSVHFIEMGQGMIAPVQEGEEVAVCTSPLYSCTLVVGYNKNTGKYGAYHYPANCLLEGDGYNKSVENQMNELKNTLKPTSLNLIFAKGEKEIENNEKIFIDSMNNLFNSLYGNPAAHSQAVIDSTFRFIDDKKIMATNMQDAYAVWKWAKDQEITPEIKLENNAAMVIRNGDLETGNPNYLKLDTDSKIGLENRKAGTHGVNGTLIIIGENLNISQDKQAARSTTPAKKARLR